MKAIHVTVAKRELSASEVDGVLHVERRAPRRNQAEGDVVLSTGLIYSTDDPARDELRWAAFLSAASSWPREHKCYLGLPGPIHLARDGKMLSVEHFLGYRFEEALKRIERELAEQAPLDVGTLRTRESLRLSRV